MSVRAARCILVLGAGGTLGQLLCELLREELPDAEIIGASRSAGLTGGRAQRYLDINEPASYGAALAGVRLLIHAAGPYHHDPGPLVSACLNNGTHYIDLAEDLHFISKVKAAAAAVSGPRSVAVPGCSTVPALVELLSSTFPGGGGKRLEVYLSLGSRNPVSGGLLFGLLRPLGCPLGHGSDNGRRAFRQLRRYRHHDGVVRSYGRYPIPFDGAVGLARGAVPVEFYVGFDRHYINAILWLASYVMPHVSSPLLRRATCPAVAVARFARRLGTDEGHLLLSLCDAWGRPVRELEVIAKKEGLKIPAAPALWASKALLAGGNNLPPVPGLVDLMAADEAIEWLTRRGYQVERRQFSEPADVH
ncbi:MAG TPA: hypothetical protein ENJ19_07635 [Gammaproteobacteria bacterium]|nr:hypothetical protein [Gammaproteobacteria bacterium]